METIDNKVEFNFLRIYSNVFTIYLYETFVFTQHNPYEYYIGAFITVLAIIFQTVYFRKLEEQKSSDEDSFVSVSFGDIEKASFKEDYEKFLDRARSDLVDGQIKQFLSKQGFGTMKT